jgi:hypothetical protein
VQSAFVVQGSPISPLPLLAAPLPELPLPPLLPPEPPPPVAAPAAPAAAPAPPDPPLAPQPATNTRIDGQPRALIGRSLFLPRAFARVEIKTPFQTVHADFPHTAYRWSVDTQHYAASRFQKGCSG